MHEADAQHAAHGRGDGDHHLAVDVEEADVALALHDPDHPEGQPADLDRLEQRIGVAEHVAGDPVAQDHHHLLGIHVLAGQEAAGNDLIAVHAGEALVGADHRVLLVAAEALDGLAGEVHLGGHRGHAGAHPLVGEGIGVIHAERLHAAQHPPPALGQGGDDGDGLAAHALETLADVALRALQDAHGGDHRGHPDDHPQGGQQAAQQVGPQATQGHHHDLEKEHARSCTLRRAGGGGRTLCVASPRPAVRAERRAGSNPGPWPARPNGRWPAVRCGRPRPPWRRG